MRQESDQTGNWREKSRGIFIEKETHAYMGVRSLPPCLYLDILSVSWKCWCMSMYWTMLSSTALKDLCVSKISLLSSISYVSVGMLRTRRNYCSNVVSLQEPLPHSSCISLDLHGILAFVCTAAYSVVSLCVC